MSARRRVYAILDLHLGGDYGEPPGEGLRGFRLCTNPNAIADFIEAVTGRLNEGPTELVADASSCVKKLPKHSI